VELYEQIRREYEHGAGTIRAVARKLGVHRREVRKALASAMPADRKIPERERPKLAAAIPFINDILEADRKAHRKQRHTAHRIWTRLCREMPEAIVAESTVRQYVRARKAAMGLLGQETFVPQSYQWGDEAQVDWYEGWVEFDGEERKTYVFCLRSMASGGAYHRAYPHATQQAFLEAHELAFAYFGGVFRVLRYDNLKSAVKKILRGYQREETARFIAFRSHWGFQAEFCTPGEGHEKGGVEGEGGQFRRNYLVPVPSVQNLEELNLLLAAGSKEDESRVIEGRAQPVGARGASTPADQGACQHEAALPAQQDGGDFDGAVRQQPSGEKRAEASPDVVRGHLPGAAGAAQGVQVVPGLHRRHAFLEGGQPDLPGALESLANNVSRVVVVPYFLTLGLHLQRDLPRLIDQVKSAHPGLTIDVTAPLDQHPAMVDALLDRALAAS